MSAELDRALTWRTALGNAAPDAVDVEVVVRLGVRDLEVVDRMLWEDRDRLVSAWDGLLAAIDDRALSAAAGPKVAATPATSGPNALQPAPRPDQSHRTRSSAGGSSAGVSSTSGMSALAAVRYEALVEYVERRKSSGEDVSNVNDANLREAAESDRVSFKRLGPFLRQHEAEVRELLAAVHVDETAAEDEPAQIPDTAEEGGPEKTGEAEGTDFAAWVYGAQTDPGPAPLEVTFTISDEGALSMAWPEPPQDHMVRIYRVVTNDQFLPNLSPELGDLLVATYDREAADTRAVEHPVRHVAVWVHEGVTERAARDLLPRLYASGSCVMPVRNCVIREDEGTVIGQWQTADGVERVDVLRIPAEVAATQTHYNPNYLLPANIVGMGGFSDDAAHPGQSYEYRVYAFANIADVGTQSPPVVRPVRVQAVLEKVEDLKVTLQEGSEDVCDLQWTRPALGKVEIYRSATPPTSGIGARVIDRGALTRQPGGLTPELLQTRQLESADGVDSMRGVPWPQGWSRVYFTAVTVLSEDQIQVGNVVILNRSAAVDRLRLVERVDEQFLTFAWPPGAGQVRIYIGSPGTPLVPELQEPVAELFEDEYVKQGGAHLAAPLPARGCVVHVVAVSFAEARSTLSEPRSIDYPGLLRLRYDVTTEEQPRGLLGRAGTTPALRRVTVTADGSVDDITLVLVNHPYRLPLHSRERDGIEVARRRLAMPEATPASVFENLNLVGMSGYIRLFVEMPAEHAHLIAVLDPAVGRLSVGDA